MTRYLAQRVLDRTWLSWDLPLEDVSITYQLNGPAQITARIDADELLRAGLEAWGSFIHVEMDGIIRASGILMPFAYEGETVSIQTAGVTRYPKGIPYLGEFTLGNPIGVAIDPLDIVRHIWAHVQSFPTGNVGAIIPATTTDVRIGEPARDVEFETDAGEQVAFTAGPYSRLQWWENTDCGSEIDSLAKDTPFDYREAPRWNTDKTDVVQDIQFGHPRLGQLLDGVSFTQGENLLQALVPIEDDDTYVSDVVVIGKGEGATTVRGQAGTSSMVQAEDGSWVPTTYYSGQVSSAGRVRRVHVLEDKKADSTTRANQIAEAERLRRQGLLTFESITISAHHPASPLGSFAVGDDVPVRCYVPGVGRTLINHRVLSFTWNPGSDEIEVEVQRSDTILYGSAT